MMIDAVCASARWAAYGDALGFISEGADAARLKRRLGANTRLRITTWRRKIGYRGPEVELPAGCYSDDTQLRLATCRAIGAQGAFDVEVFASQELPLWPIYSLGGGRGSLEAARRLSGRESWRTLVLRDKNRRYVMGGGNGGAMRVQPHAWAGHRDLKLANAIVENVACTHGHPKAFVGALFHVHCLCVALDDARLASPELAVSAAAFAAASLESATSILGDEWLGNWNRSSGLDFVIEWNSAVREITDITDSLDGLADQNSYVNLLRAHGLLDDSERGSATKTAAAAYAAISLFQDKTPEYIIDLIATTLNSDTDSIATMAAAILGAALRPPLSDPLQDHDYLISEAIRVAKGAPAAKRHTSSNKQQVVIEGNHIGFGPLGEGIAIGSRYGKLPDTFRWYKLDIGQTILVNENHTRVKRPSNADEVPGLFEQTRSPASTSANSVPERTESPLDVTPNGHFRNESEVTAYARRLVERGLDPAKIGLAIIALTKRDAGEGLAAVFAYEIVRLARATRQRHVDNVPPNASANPRPKPMPLIQLQLTAKLGDSRIELIGIIANYGRETALHVRVMLLGRREPLVEFQKLAVQERHDLHVVVQNVEIVPHDRVLVHFDTDAAVIRQEGVFEANLGHPDTLLFKGLGAAVVET